MYFVNTHTPTHTPAPPTHPHPPHLKRVNNHYERKREWQELMRHMASLTKCWGTTNQYQCITVYIFLISILCWQKLWFWFLVVISSTHALVLNFIQYSMLNSYKIHGAKEDSHNIQYKMNEWTEIENLKWKLPYKLCIPVFRIRYSNFLQFWRVHSEQSTTWREITWTKRQLIIIIVS